MSIDLVVTEVPHSTLAGEEGKTSGRQAYK